MTCLGFAKSMFLLKFSEDSSWHCGLQFHNVMHNRELFTKGCSIRIRYLFHDDSNEGSLLNRQKKYDFVRLQDLKNQALLKLDEVCKKVKKQLKCKMLIFYFRQAYLNILQRIFCTTTITRCKVRPNLIDGWSAWQFLQPLRQQAELSEASRL